jgi:8-oxo-dGTP pyrophosphatase MutT (NUDIX family)
MLQPGESPVDAALREAAEEIGIAPELVTVLGTATPLYVPASHTAVMPIIAALAGPLHLHANPAEVERIDFLSLQALSQTPPSVGVWERRGSRVRVPFWRLHGVPLWGATAMIVNELLWLYREFAGIAPTEERAP